MPIIKPISDLRNYNEVIKDVAYGEPVFLTKNGRGKFVILDIAGFMKGYIKEFLAQYKDKSSEEIINLRYDRFRSF